MYKYVKKALGQKNPNNNNNNNSSNNFPLQPTATSVKTKKIEAQYLHLEYIACNM